MTNKQNRTLPAQPALCRILDANLDRAREGVGVVRRDGSPAAGRVDEPRHLGPGVDGGQQRAPRGGCTPRARAVPHRRRSRATGHARRCAAARGVGRADHRRRTGALRHVVHDLRFNIDNVVLWLIFTHGTHLFCFAGQIKQSQQRFFLRPLRHNRVPNLRQNLRHLR